MSDHKPDRAGQDRHDEDLIDQDPDILKQPQPYRAALRAALEGVLSGGELDELYGEDSRPAGGPPQKEGATP